MPTKTTVKAHRGFAHVPLRGRRRRRPPIQQPTGRPRRPLTPAQRDRMRKQMEAARRRFNQQRRRRRLTPTETMQMEALRRRQQEALNNPKARPRLPIRRRPTVEQLSDARRRRRPVGDPKPRRRVTTAKKQVKQATQAPRTRPKSRRV